MVNFVVAKTLEQYKEIASLADTIWREHYIPIVGKPQIDYMLDKFQSDRSIQSQVEQGFEYHTINIDNNSVGYISIKNEDDVLFLSKIYLLKSQRGKKIGKGAMDFVESRAKALGLNSIRLTVNKNNINSIKAYEKLGFKNKGSVLIDIGNGFVMDDYQMVKTF